MSDFEDARPVVGLDEGVASATVVPIDALSPEALHALVESFVLREGTDYGAVERTLEQKIADVMRQLKRGEARIEFDPKTESVDVVVARPRE